ncbi:hypothetical protein FDP41_006141 [Naegleria fowleri]|uniref:Uncharacterized protein n=1 Tax=Naegleria fowleri TaxID=5763 RepID=A0A6A5BC42_NAEFO|nr:uncharacterized protein FDP41_006141 [Naegleria fowleri]KAF0974667.1 hypothetical protein FDP41_006141 [Naegleria fowleri]
MKKCIEHLTHENNPNPKKRKVVPEEDSSSSDDDDVGGGLNYTTFCGLREQEYQKDKKDDEDQRERFAQMPKTDLIGLFFDDKLKYHRPPIHFDPELGTLISCSAKPSKKKREKFQKTVFGYCRECNEKVNGGLQAMKEHILSCPKLNDFKDNDICQDVVMRFKIYQKYADNWNKIYESDEDFMDNEVDNKHMDVPMYRVFKPSDVGKQFCYTYDFGSSTYLELELMSLSNETRNTIKLEYWQGITLPSTSVVSAREMPSGWRQLSLTCIVTHAK